MTKEQAEESSDHSDLVIPSTFDIRHSKFSGGLISKGAQLSELMKEIAPHSRIAIDTEADSLHCYKEKLCLLQISTPQSDAIVDPFDTLVPRAGKLTLCLAQGFSASKKAGESGVVGDELRDMGEFQKPIIGREGRDLGRIELGVFGRFLQGRMIGKKESILEVGTNRVLNHPFP